MQNSEDNVVSVDIFVYGEWSTTIEVVLIGNELDFLDAKSRLKSSLKEYYKEGICPYIGACAFCNNIKNSNPIMLILDSSWMF